MEIWKDIEGYEGQYQVSNIGRIKSLDRMEYISSGEYYRRRRGRMMRLYYDKDGYLKVMLRKNGKGKRFMVHRLVAQAFIPNPEKHPVINHKNEIKDDNLVSNLEWCTVRDNNVYNGRAKKAGRKTSKPVIGEHIETGDKVFFESIAEAIKEGYGDYHISDVCNGKRSHSFGYKWKYA